ncbi:hypothetical protein BRDID11004_29180 [Bradyrhizobium diazoefficiens]|uniref:Uncharacterized protein n=2 Tax=Bradyrhizobium diazoefficiens TaxID=1355477 RepID=A0A810A470_9BRAD|nr:hypothetical protein F07S3_60080 [Bradyrhizobium diazoefficiens]BCA13860.1 hypothetical protein BDHF08_57070 [Bradyrhizobium diazoefficiens]BCE58270.1 hypothetical protein XF5B_57820 [Bradyrhizobium diazoefficiens]BCE66947.1 hypothetical protein XF6B_57460 [Bradyrhizobium diazoefficiens]
MLPPEASHDRCYMRELHNCEGSISGEHLISETVIEVLRGEGDFTVSGLAWQEAGEEKRLAPGNLTANCLCRRHNSALSPLDSAAGLFFSGLRECMEEKIAPTPYLFSGHDIERWLLKTLKAMAVSRNLARGRIRLPGSFQRDIDVIELLDDPSAWSSATGIYFIMPAGARFVNNPRFRLQPWFGDAQEEIVGLWASFVGLEFVVMIAAPNVSSSPDLKRWLYRPGSIEMSIGNSRRQIELSWEDGLAHAPIKFAFERPVNS